MTSHDVVNAVRRMAGQRKVGHAGTLDPLATGVLLVCLGQATRVVEYLMAGRKRYRATIILGITTDTDDVEGKVIFSGGDSDFSREEIECALAGFVGCLNQVPPLYSALKHDGQPLYRLARRGEAVEVQRLARPIVVDEITLLNWTPPTVMIEVACSPGTYMRSLARDLGQHLGGGAHLTSLVRLRSGRFTLSDAVSLDCLEEAFERGREGQYLLPVDEALLDLPVLVLGPEDARRVLSGQDLSIVPGEGDGEGTGVFRRVYSGDGDLLAVVTYDAAAQCWHPRKVFGAGSRA
jgi:tRNA pseudouridine55 synthase